MKKGDKIAVIDEQLEGIITEVKENQITFITSEGFAYTYPKEKVVVMSPDFHQKITAKAVSVKDNRKNINTPPKSHKNKPVFDLHIEKIMPKHRHLSPGQKLAVQLQEVHRILQKMSHKHYKEIVLIHGQGKGVLRQEIIKILQVKGYQYTDASYQKYGSGALLVLLKT